MATSVDSIIRRAQKSPTSVAIEDDGTAVTYAELADQVLQLARQVSATTELRSVVAVEATRSPGAIAAMLAVMFARRIYCPLDPAMPAARRQFLVDLARPSLFIDGDGTPSLRESGMPGLGAAPDRDDAAYLLFTSGSTGEPKGVLGTHRALRNLSFGLSELYSLSPADRLLQFAAFSWDTSLEEIFPALSSGCTLVLRPRVLDSIQNFAEFCAGKSITGLNLPTAYWVQLVESDVQLPQSTRLVVIGGEAVPADAVTSWRRQYGDRIRLTNTYGLTESGAVSTASDLHDRTPVATESFAPIGTPIAGVEIRVVDRDGADAPDGDVGELMLSGEGIAGGYLGAAAPDDPGFGADPVTGIRWLRTGDLAVRAADGQLYFRGRRDEQLKIRGHRVAPGEVERAIRNLAGVSECAVVSPPGSGRLQAHVARTPGWPLDAGGLRLEIQSVLPDYMWPGAIHIAEALPKLPSGKIDRQALLCAAQTDGTIGDQAGPLLQAVAEVLGTAARPDTSLISAGGDSISAISITTRMQRIGYRVTASDLLTAERIADVRISRAAIPDPAPGVMVKLWPGRLPLTPMQQGILFEVKLAPDEVVYVDQDVWSISGPLDIEEFWNAWREIVKRHDALRTGFHWPDGEEPYSVVYPQIELPSQVLDWRGCDRGECEARLAQLLQGGSRQPIDPARCPLMSLQLIRQEDELCLFAWRVHRLILDGWSTSLVMDELAEIYAAAVERRPPVLPPVTPFQAFARLASRPPSAQSVEHWRRYLDGAAVTPLPGHDRPQPRNSHAAGAHQRASLVLDAGVVQRLHAMCRGGEVTTSTVFRAAWAVLLGRYAGRADVMFGATSSGRSALPEEGNCIGLLINTLPVRVQIDPAEPVSGLLRRIQSESAAAAGHELTPLASLRTLLNSTEAGLFESVLIFQNYPGAQSYSRDGVVRMVHLTGEEQIHYPLSLTVVPRENGTLCIEIWYDSDLIDPTVGTNLADHLVVILEAFADDPDQLVESVPRLGPGERETLAAWSKGPAPAFEHPVNTLAVFDATAARYPDNCAVEAGDHKVTYQELYSMSAEAAGNLRRMGVSVGQIVGLSGQRSVATIAALLGVWRAGCAYLGIDEILPPARCAQVVAEAEPSVLILGNPDVPFATAAQTVPISAIVGGSGAATDFTAPAVVVPVGAECTTHDGADPAYVVFTSGSTGTPKGVVVAHGGLANYVLAAVAKYDLTPADRGLVGASIGVDWFASELYPLLCSGATAVLRERDAYQDPATVLDFWNSKQITVAIPPTAVWHQIARDIASRDELPASLRVIDIGGERAVPALLGRWLDVVGDAVVLLNGYGPTEATIEATSCVLSGQGKVAVPAGREVPIGRPLQNVECHVLDSSHQVVPIGGVGELFIAGAGVAIGYLNDADLTAERFVAGPGTGRRMYRTGDVVRWLPTGVLEYLGRNDRQLKLGGNRFEAGDVEAAVLAHPDVGEAWLSAQHDDDGTVVGLAAYVVPVAGRSPRPDDIRNHLRERLPSSLVPRAISILPELPRNLSGKVDESALPRPAARGRDERDERDELPYDLTPDEAPEAANVLRVLGDALGMETLNLSFFDAGGNSIVAMRMIGILRRDLQIKASFRSLVSAPSLREFARRAVSEADVAGREDGL